MTELKRIDGEDKLRASAVEMLERTLEEARRGEVRSVFMVVDYDQGFRTRYSAFKDRVRMVGSLRVLEHELLLGDD